MFIFEWFRSSYFFNLIRHPKRYVDLRIRSGNRILWASKSSKKKKHQSPGYISTEPPAADSCPGATPSIRNRVCLFALIIGINEYKSPTVTPLLGAISDAEAMKEYLESTLDVPATQIKTLFGPQADRISIIRELGALSTDTRIQTGDPILVFYAGHGSKTSSPEKLGQSDTQFIVPYDYCDIKGSEVHGIPDRTIGCLLEELANAKGDNITVILDCCYSGSGTRHPSRFVRSVETSMDIPEDIDRDVIAGARKTEYPKGFIHSGLKSHVLLAACGAQEEAKEENGRGYFTEALIKALGAVDTDKITYTDLIHRIPSLPQQNPQCEGYNRTRALFNAKAPSRNKRLFTVLEKDGVYTMTAGAANGVAKGAEFSIYKDQESVSNGSPLGILKASEPGPFSTVMELTPEESPFPIVEQAFALQIRTGEEESLPLHISADARLVSIFEAVVSRIQEGSSTQEEIRLVPNKDEAELDVTLDENDNIVFNIIDPLVTRYGLTRLPFCVQRDVNEVRRIVRAASRYYWHLRRTSGTRNLESKINTEFNKVRAAWDKQFRRVIEPMGPNLICHGVIDVVVDENAMYGIKVTNNTNLALYLSVFYFDNSDLSISSYFQPPASRGKADVSLPPRGTLAIGYGGPEGSIPFNYSLRKGQNVDVGFLKLFLSTEQVDLSDLEQPSPFGEERQMGKIVSKALPAIWDVILIPIVQRRRPVEQTIDAIW